MSNNTARHYTYEETPVRRRAPAPVIPLHPTRQQRLREWARRTLTSETIAEAVLAVTTLVLSGELVFILYQGIHHYRVF